MAARIFTANSWKSEPVNPAENSVLLECDGYYWHLYRYFEGANLDKRQELVDLYGDAEIDGYQLDRLDDEMTSALRDTAAKPDQWQVLTGWNNMKARDNEIWKTVDKVKLVELIEQIRWLIAYAREQHLKLIVSGD